MRLAWILDTYEEMADSAWTRVRHDIVSILELFIGIIAASLPRLKAPAQRTLYRLGLLSATSAPDVNPNFPAAHFIYVNQSVGPLAARADSRAQGSCMCTA